MLGGASFEHAFEIVYGVLGERLECLVPFMNLVSSFHLRTPLRSTPIPITRWFPLLIQAKTLMLSRGTLESFCDDAIPALLRLQSASDRPYYVNTNTKKSKMRNLLASPSSLSLSQSTSHFHGYTYCSELYGRNRDRSVTFSAPGIWETGHALRVTVPKLGNRRQMVRHSAIPRQNIKLSSHRLQGRF
jgi:hypothetical protein